MRAEVSGLKFQFSSGKFLWTRPPEFFRLNYRQRHKLPAQLSAQLSAHPATNTVRTGLARLSFSSVLNPIAVILSNFQARL
jgi:hypothetical protein